jgi:uncharacterized protein YcbK (DUF882 family)
MNRRLAILFVAFAFAAMALAAPRSAEAGRGVHPTGTIKQCSTKQVGKKKKKVCKRVAIFSGHNADRSKLRTEPLEKPSGKISVKADHFGGESLDVNIYKDDGSFDEAALAQLDELFRCKRSNEVRAVDPRLYEMLSRIYDHFGEKQVQLVSGFRFTERESSRHHHASAMDIKISGVSIKDMYAFAESLDGGGMGVGIYPTSGFIHVDYRAPGEPSYRWTDLSGPGTGPDGKARGGKDKKAKKGNGKGGKAKGKGTPARTKPARKATS